MKTTPKTFPVDYRDDPQFKHWAAIFDVLSQCQRAGEVVFNFAAPEHAGGIAAFVWLEGEGRFGLTARPAPCTLNPETRQWFSHGPSGPVAVPDPVQRSADAAMAMRQEILNRTNFEVFTIPVVIFTDMEPDPAIVRRVSSTNVCAAFGVSRLLLDLDAAAKQKVVLTPPSARHVRNEAEALRRAFGIGEAEQPVAPEPDDGGEVTVEELGLSAHHITIRIDRVDQLIVRPAPGDATIVQDLRP